MIVAGLGLRTAFASLLVLACIVATPLAVNQTSLSIQTHPANPGDVVVSRYNLERTGVATDVGDITAPAILWSFQTNGTVATSPLAADLDGDESLELFFGEFKPTPAGDGTRFAYVLDATGRVESLLPVRFNSVAAAAVDLDGDMHPEIVIAEGSHSDEIGGLGFRVFRADGSPLWSFETEAFGGEGFFASPAIADVDGDGRFDLIAGSMDETVYALRGGDGSVLWRTPRLEHYVRHSPPIADLDGDGDLEVVVITEAGTMHALDAITGIEAWSLDLGDIVAATPAVGDLNEDGDLEIVASLVVEGGVAAVSGSGAVLWQVRAHDFSYRGPTLVDVDGDGLPDVVEGDSDDPRITAYRGTDGEILWERPLAAPWASGPLVAGDVDGDGETEILLGTDLGLTLLSAATGAVEWEFPLPPVRGEPLLRDLDGDGVAEIYVGAGDGRLYAIGTPRNQAFSPRTIGYWKHQCAIPEARGDHVGIPDSFLAAIREQSDVFKTLNMKEEACLVLAGPRANDMAARAGQQLLALWLNIASGFVDKGVSIELPMTSSGTIGGAIDEVEAILLGSSDRAELERAELERAKDICDALNNGQR